MTRIRRPGLDQEQDDEEVTEQGAKNEDRWVTGSCVWLSGFAVVAGQSGDRWDDWRRRPDEDQWLWAAGICNWEVARVRDRETEGQRLHLLT